MSADRVTNQYVLSTIKKREKAKSKKYPANLLVQSPCARPVFYNNNIVYKA